MLDAADIYDWDEDETMIHKPLNTPAIMKSLVLPSALFIILAIAQIVLAFIVLTSHVSNRWFLAITTGGIILSIAIIACTTIYSFNRAHGLGKSCH